VRWPSSSKLQNTTVASPSTAASVMVTPSSTVRTRTRDAPFALAPAAHNRVEPTALPKISEMSASFEERVLSTIDVVGDVSFARQPVKEPLIVC